MRGVRSTVAVGVVGLVLSFGSSVDAACHFFTVGASSSVNEGDKVDIVVERDAALADSSVRVRTVNKTAKTPGDFTALDQRVAFTGNETQKTVSVQTKEDATKESTEAFQVAVSEGQGCAPNPNYGYGDPATITIKDDDVAPAAPATSKPQPAATTAPRTSSPTPTPSPSPTPTGTASPTPSPSPTPTFTAVAVEEDDGGFPWLPVLAVTGFLAAAGGALILTRLRRGGV